MEMWIVSDSHFHHENIIGFCSRPFKDAREMDEYMVTMWNEMVKPQDHVRHLGDVTLERGGRGSPQAGRFTKLIRSLHGHKRLFLGNHDHFMAQTYLDAGFEKLYATWRDDGLLYSHFPIHPNSLGFGVNANVHGHIHQQDSPQPAIWVDKSGKVVVTPYINVCVEKTAYGPISLDEVKSRVKEAKRLGGDSEFV